MRLAGAAVVLLALAAGPPAVGASAGPPPPLEACRAREASIAECLLRRGPDAFAGAPDAVSRRGVPAPGPLDCVIPGMDSRCEVWTATYDNPNGGGYGPDQATDIAAGDRRTYVTGGSWDDTTAHYDIATVAYDQATGERAWAARHDGEAGLFDVAYAVAVDEPEERVVVAGTCDGEDPYGNDVAVVAHDAATGAELWSTCWDDPLEDFGMAYAVTFSADGEQVHAAGRAHGDVVVLTLDAATGDVVWHAEVDGPAGGYDIAFDVAAAPDGSRVYTTGFSENGPADLDYLTAAFRARIDDPEDRDLLGELLWLAPHDGGFAGLDQATALALTPDGSRLLVTGLSQRTLATPADPPAFAATTIGYYTADGRQDWLSRYEPTPTVGAGQTAALSVAMDPDGTHAYIAGITPGTTSRDSAFFTAGYAVSDGTRAWATPFQPPGSTYGLGTSVAVSRDGSRVYTTGPSFEGYFSYKGDMATVAHETTLGHQVWAARFTRPGDDVADLLPYPAFAATGPTRVFVAATYVNYYPEAESGLPVSFSDYWTMAYES